jgi:hypothetical protein
VPRAHRRDLRQHQRCCARCAPAGTASATPTPAPSCTWYQEQGLAALAQFNGWFSGVLLDLPARRAVLFNDRYGLSRMHVHAADDGLYFASEAKALLRTFPALRRLDAASLAQVHTFGCVLGDRTLYPGWTCCRRARPGRPRPTGPCVARPGSTAAPGRSRRHAGAARSSRSNCATCSRGACRPT